MQDLSAVRRHPDLPGAPALNGGLIFGTIGVEVSGTHVIITALVTLPCSVVEVHRDDLRKMELQAWST